MTWALWLLVLVGGTGMIVRGAETFAEHLGRAAARLGVGAFALALLLAGAEPEELATVVVSSLRDSPGIGFGDIIGANVAVCLVALGVGAALMTLQVSMRILTYALCAVPVSIISVVLIWDGELSRPEGALLIALYAAYVGAVWLYERAPPSLGEVDELKEAEEELEEVHGHGRGRVGVDLVLVFAGLAALAVGSSILVEAVRQITNVEATQTKLGLTVVGFATAFELVVLVWSAVRRGATEVALAGVDWLLRLQPDHEPGSGRSGQTAAYLRRGEPAPAGCPHAGKLPRRYPARIAATPYRASCRPGSSGGLPGVRPGSEPLATLLPHPSLWFP